MSPTSVWVPGATARSGNFTWSTAQRSFAGTALMNSHLPAAGSSTTSGRPSCSWMKREIGFHTASREAWSTSRNRYA